MATKASRRVKRGKVVRVLNQDGAEVETVMPAPATRVVEKVVVEEAPFTKGKIIEGLKRGKSWDKITFYRVVTPGPQAGAKSLSAPENGSELMALLQPATATVTAEDAVKFLREGMGRNLLSLTLGVKPTSVDRYLRGDNISPKIEQRILDAYAAWQEVAKVEAPETVRAWFMGMKEVLNDLSPAEAISEDLGRSVMSVARAYVQRA